MYFGLKSVTWSESCFIDFSCSQERNKER